MIIKKATINDLDALVALEDQLFDSASFAMNKRAFAYHIKKESLLLCAFHEERLVGYILLFVHKKSCRIYAIGVSKSVQKMGIGKELVLTALSKLNSSIEYVYLEVREDNLNAIKAYESLGFSVKKVKPNYYPDGVNALRMQRLLNV